MDRPIPPERIVQSLCDLGLTRTEAEVYLTCLDLAGDGPVSSYRAAQAMGRDPANVGKIIDALVRQRAVRVVQEKPRLYVPVPPPEFSDQVLARMQARRDEAVRLLAAYRTPAPAGVAAALATPEQTFAKAREMLAACRRRAVVFGSGDVLRELGHALEQAADPPSRRVLVLSPVPFSSDTVEIATLPDDAPPPGAGQPDHAADGRWLHLAVDDSMWLTAVLDDAAGAPQAAGWWSTGTATAGVIAAALELAWRQAAVPAPTVEPAAAEPVPAAPPEATAAARSDAPAAPRDAPESPEAPEASEPAFEEGIKFVFRRTPPPAEGELRAKKNEA